MTNQDLKKTLDRIHRRGFNEYKEIKGSYSISGFTLNVDFVQWDAWAPPSHLSVQVPLEKTGFPPSLYNSPGRKVAFRDFIGREFKQAIQKICKGNRGPGNSGMVDISCGGREILDRSSVMMNGEFLEVRFLVGLPAEGRSANSREAESMFFQKIPAVVHQAMLYENIDASALNNHIKTAEDTEALRSALKENGLVGFIGNGSVLPRESGMDGRPLKNGIPFIFPVNLETNLVCPNRGEVRGMGIPKGVTLIVGGGFHGKSTLLNALEVGVYNHIPGDGRELVVTIPEAVKIRAEDGRRVEKVDISPFINKLPYGKDTVRFCTDNASGSTSQAANIIEALEMGVQALFIDEDTSATNFMIRDERMQELVVKDKEPITPFVDRVRQLYDDYGVSTILVMGGSGDYFDSADTVIMMDDYQPVDKTQKVKEIIKKHHTRRTFEGGESFGEVRARYPDQQSFHPSKGMRNAQWQEKGEKQILFGKETIDLSFLEQLVDPAQTRAIELAIPYCSSGVAESDGSLRKCLEVVMEEIETKGLDILSTGKTGDIARPRIFELAAGINRMRGLRIK